MGKQNAEKAIFRKYFSDLYKWIFAVTVLFVITYTVELLGGWNISWGRYWIIPVCFLVIYLLILPFYILFFSAVKEMKKDCIQEATVLVQAIVRDKKYNFYNKGGAMVGKEKCILIDSNDNEYRVVLDQRIIVEMHPSEYYKNAQVVIRYLPKSRIALHMKLKSLKISDTATQHLYKDFHEYFL